MEGLSHIQDGGFGGVRLSFEIYDFTSFLCAARQSGMKNGGRLRDAVVEFRLGPGLGLGLGHGMVMAMVTAVVALWIQLRLWIELWV